MPWCPKCRTEYREGFAFCYDCEVDLVDSLDKAPKNDLTVKAAIETSKARDLLGIGSDAYDKDEFEEALEHFTGVIKLHPNHPEAYAMLGLTFSALGFTREAWRSFKLALKADANDPNTLFYAADFLTDQGDYEMAKILAGRFLEVEKDSEEKAEMDELLERINAHLEAGDKGKFTADIAIDLENLLESCKECKARLPADAPYCPVCGAIHFYGAEIEEVDEFDTEELDE